MLFHLACFTAVTRPLHFTLPVRLLLVSSLQQTAILVVIRSWSARPYSHSTTIPPPCHHGRHQQHSRCISSSKTEWNSLTTASSCPWRQLPSSSVSDSSRWWTFVWTASTHQYWKPRLSWYQTHQFRVSQHRCHVQGARLSVRSSTFA